MFKDILSYKGRIRRTEYCLTYLGYIITSSLLDYFSIYADSLIFAVIRVAIMLPLFWVLIVQGAKRCHDRGNSGWYQIIPFYVFWMFFADSDDGPNEYGDNPKGIGNYNELDEIGKEVTNYD